MDIAKDSQVGAKGGRADTKRWGEVPEFALLVSSFAGGPFAAAQLAVSCRDMYRAVSEAWSDITRRFPTRLYVVGGLDTSFQEVDTLWRLTPGEESWEVLPSSGLPAAGSGITAAMGKVYLFGGELSGDALHDVRCFDPAAGSWENLPPMKQGRIRPAAVYSQGFIYVLGGLDGTITLPSCERFNLNLKVWEELPDMNCPRYAGGACSLSRGRILAFAGELSDAGLAASLEVFDPKAKSWELLPPVRTPTCGATVVVSRGGQTGFTIGGLGLSGQALPMAETLPLGRALATAAHDPSRFQPPTWSSLPPMQIARHLTSATAFQRGVAVIGGKGPKFEAIPNSEVFDPEAGAWKALCPLPTPRLRAAVIAGRL